MDGLFISTLIKNPAFGGMWVLLVIFSVCCHEYFHARVALWQGDSTAADNGHLTLNPLRQMGIISLIMLMFIGIAWGAVPVNPSRMKHRYSDALVSFAGPATNLMLFFIFAIGYSVMAALWHKGAVSYEVQWAIGLFSLFQLGAVLNFVLFVFNMLPVPVLDGWKVFSYFFPALHRVMVTSEASRAAFIIIFFIAVMFIEYLFMLAQIILLLISSFLMIVLKLAGL